MFLNLVCGNKDEALKLLEECDALTRKQHLMSCYSDGYNIAHHIARTGDLELLHLLMKYLDEEDLIKVVDAGLIEPETSGPTEKMIVSEMDYGKVSFKLRPTPLKIATVCGHTTIVKELIKIGCRPFNGSDYMSTLEWEISPFGAAIYYDRIELVMLYSDLLDKSMKHIISYSERIIASKSKDEKSIYDMNRALIMMEHPHMVISLSMLYNVPRVMKYLIERFFYTSYNIRVSKFKFPLVVKNPTSKQPLVYAVSTHNHLIVRELINMGFDPNDRNESCNFPIITTCESPDEKSVLVLEELLKHATTNVNAMIFGRTALNACVCLNNTMSWNKDCNDESIEKIYDRKLRLLLAFGAKHLQKPKKSKNLRVVNVLEEAIDNDRRDAAWYLLLNGGFRLTKNLVVGMAFVNKVTLFDILFFRLEQHELRSRILEM
jgi:ankyrin repeat protein